MRRAGPASANVYRAGMFPMSDEPLHVARELRVSSEAQSADQRCLHGEPMGELLGANQ